MTGWVNFSLTFVLAAACTVATSAVVLYTTQYLIRDHHSTVLRNQFKTKALRIKNVLKTIETEYQTSITVLSRNSHASLSANTTAKPQHEFDQETLDGTFEHQPPSSKEKLILEETMTQLLERLDELHPRKLLDHFTQKEQSILDQSTVQWMQSQMEKLQSRKKYMINNIHETCDQLNPV